MATRRRVILLCLGTALAALVSAALLAAAVLVPAPASVLPLVIPACLCGPMTTAYELAHAMSALRDPEAALRRELDRLPETPHPLGL